MQPGEHLQLPPGWQCYQHVSSGGKTYKRYHGPNGERSQSSKEAWRKAAALPPAPAAPAAAAPPRVTAADADEGEAHGGGAPLQGLERWGAPLAAAAPLGAPLPHAAAVLAGTPAADAYAAGARGVTSQFMSLEEIAATTAAATAAAAAAGSSATAAALATGAAADRAAAAAAGGATSAAAAAAASPGMSPGVASPGGFQCRYGCGFTTRHSMGLGGHTRSG